MSGVYPIADYYTIFPLFGNVTNFGLGESTFNVPQSTYLSNAKGQYCLISLADASVDFDSVELPIVVSLQGVSNNGGEDAVLGHFSITAEQGNTRFHHTFNKNDVKYLISARPSQIRIRTFQEDKTALPLTSGYLTFKFEYLSKEAVRVMNDESDYNTF
jgi:hypothetical protein